MFVFYVDSAVTDVFTGHGRRTTFLVAEVAGEAAAEQDYALEVFVPVFVQALLEAEAA